MNIKCESDNFFKIYNEMQGVGIKASKLCKKKRAKAYHYTTYILLYFLITNILVFVAVLFLQEYKILFNIMQVLLFFLIFMIVAMTLLFIIGYYSTKKRLGGIVNISKKGVEDNEKSGLVFFAPWNLIDFAYFGKYGIYFFVGKRIVIFGDNKSKKELRKYLEEEKIDVLICDKED